MKVKIKLEFTELFFIVSDMEGGLLLIEKKLFG